MLSHLQNKSQKAHNHDFVIDKVGIDTTLVSDIIDTTVQLLVVLWCWINSHL